VSGLTVHPTGTRRPASDLAIARAAVVEALPGDERHESARAEILSFIDAHPDALHRSCSVGHVTASALVVDPSTRHVLLLFHTKVQRWLQPGGHADGDADLAHVALREAEEETGIVGLAVVTPAIDLDVHVFHNATGTEPDHLHLDVRHLVLAPPGSEPVQNHESEGLVWVAADDLARYDVDPGTIRMARAGLATLDLL
jgi:8-oxo-dGTP pyrophosphatase MutT (NUDIX family)